MTQMILRSAIIESFSTAKKRFIVAQIR